MKAQIARRSNGKALIWKQGPEEDDDTYNLFLQYMSASQNDVFLTPKQFALANGRSDIADSIEWWDERKRVAVDEILRNMTSRVKVIASETMIEVIGEMRAITADTAKKLDTMRRMNSTTSPAYLAASQQMIDLALALSKTVQAYQRNVTAIQVNNKIGVDNPKMGFQDTNGDIIEA